jgi:hypothetical protein
MQNILLCSIGWIVREKKIKPNVVDKAIKKLEINPGKKNPMVS